MSARTLPPLVRATRDTWRLCVALRRWLERHPDATMLEGIRAAVDGRWDASDAELLRGLR